MIGQRGYRFAGGERQPMAIARILLRNPPVLILDEATSALGNNTERSVQAALDRLSAGYDDRHRAPSTVEQSAQIVVSDQGSIVERGTHRELLRLDGLHTARQLLDSARHLSWADANPTRT